MLKRLISSGSQPLADGGASTVVDKMAESSQHRHPTPTVAGPTLMGLMASKRLAKRLSNKVITKRSSYLGSRSSASMFQQAPKEPSYRMEPHKKFASTSVQEVIKSVLDSRLEGFKYNPKFCANMIKVLSEEIKDRVKMLNFDRYRIICVITLCQRGDQSIVGTSRCSWDSKLDNFASYTFENEHLICSATVFGVYKE